MADGSRVRIRTAQERKRALAQLTELRTAGLVEKAMVIVLRRDGNYEVLGQELAPFEMTRLLAVAAQAVMHAEEQRTAHRPEPLEIPVAWGEESSPGDRIRPKITADAQGILRPPPGETFISCPVCHHPRYFVCVGEPGTPMADLPVRIACGHCKNEVSWMRDDYEQAGD